MNQSFLYENSNPLEIAKNPFDTMAMGASDGFKPFDVYEKNIIALVNIKSLVLLKCVQLIL